MGNVLGLVVLGAGGLLIYLGITGRYNTMLSALGAVALPAAGAPGEPSRDPSSGPTVGGASTPPAMGRGPGQTGPS